MLHSRVWPIDTAAQGVVKCALGGLLGVGSLFNLLLSVTLTTRV